MENPATWNRAERIVHEALREFSSSAKAGVIGLSLTRQITDALRKAGLLVEETPERHPEWEACR